MSKNRSDIQVLRGLAIFLVLLHHANLLSSLKAGYLGVDIFFVISGYLITGIVQRDLLAGKFSFTGFYLRRAKRLLPAAYTTFLVTAVMATAFLTRSEMWDFCWQLLGAVTFTGNIALWMQTGYFEGAADLKPLLHVWSLSIEEQYYLLLPAMLVYVPRRYWKLSISVLLLASLVTCLVMVSLRPGAAFYLLPTRAWEMALGSAGVLLLEGTAFVTWLNRLFWPALGAVLLVPFFPLQAPHPSWNALMVCVSTLIILLRRHSLFDDNRAGMINQALLLRPLAWLGDISYSLYLVHWPFLALAANAWVSPVPGKIRLSLVFAAVLVAWGMYRWIEQPTRKRVLTLTPYSLAAVLTVSVLVATSGFYSFFALYPSSSPDYLYMMRGNMGLNAGCEYSNVFTKRPECQTSDRPELLIWGDSYAMQWVAGLEATADVGIIQATRSSCGPLEGISMVRSDGFYNRAWAEKCIQFNEDVKTYLAVTPSVRTVVLASVFSQYMSGTDLIERATAPVGEASEKFRKTAGSEVLAIQALARTIQDIRSMGRKVVLMAPPPSALGVNFGRCLERKATGKLIFGAGLPSCAIPRNAYGKGPVASFLVRAESDLDVPIFRPDKFLCHDDICDVEMDGVFLYRDNGHLSYDGSRLLAKKLDLAGQLIRMAR